MADENTNVTNNEELDPVVNNEEPAKEDPVEEEPVVDKEEDNKDDKEITPEQKAKAAYIALRFLGVTPPSL
ncbi:MAG: hypothetical protein IJ880_14445 [Bacilli bacterium]|nr:hypothetical protein [Bacilli bacterium]